MMVLKSSVFSSFFNVILFENVAAVLAKKKNKHYFFLFV